MVYVKLRTLRNNNGYTVYIEVDVDTLKHLLSLNEDLYDKSKLILEQQIDITCIPIGTEAKKEKLKYFGYTDDDIKEIERQTPEVFTD